MSISVVVSTKITVLGVFLSFSSNSSLGHWNVRHVNILTAGLDVVYYVVSIGRHRCCYWLGRRLCCVCPYVYCMMLEVLEVLKEHHWEERIGGLLVSCRPSGKVLTHFPTRLCSGLHQ